MIFAPAWLRDQNNRRQNLTEKPNLLVSDFDYDLPEELIATEPSAERDGSRLLVLPRGEGAIHWRFCDIG